MQRFCDRIVCYLGFLAAISNSQIVQWICFCPTDCLPVISYLKTNSLRLRIYTIRCILKIRFVSYIKTY